MAAKSQVRERILDAAVMLLRRDGLKRLAQPQVAREAQVPQGHLTYYFPKKADMLMAVAARFLQLLESDVVPLGPAGRSAAVLALVKRLALDRERTRMLLGLLIEADDDPVLRGAMTRSAGFVRDTLATAFGLAPESREAQLALALAWGLGLQQFLLGDQRSAEETEALLEHAVGLIQNASRTRMESSPEVPPV
ncbi:MAG: TetR/AcrR family transcriptional regulator [Myxococcales bacterium]|nr:MAG: TetR/AcrR family transcriptional regulator [Myxococcales bacterium]